MCDPFTIMAVASVAQGAGKMLSSDKEAGQYKDRASQVLQAGMQEIDQAAYTQSRYRGEQKAAYGKAGVKLTGSAKTFTDEQLLQDEKTLLTMKYNTKLGVRDELNKYVAKKKEGMNSLVSGMFSAAGYGMNAGSGMGLSNMINTQMGGSYFGGNIQGTPWR